MNGNVGWRSGWGFVGLVLPALVIGCEATHETFLGWPDDQARRIADEQPDADPRVREQVTMTEVRTVAYETYQSMRSAGQVTVEERRNGQVYFAVQRTMPVPITGRPGMAPAMVYVGMIERYRAGVPEASPQE